MIIQGAANTRLFRLRVLMLGLRSEIQTGMKLTRGRSAYSIIKSEFNLKGSKQSVYNQFVELYNLETQKVQP